MSLALGKESQTLASAPKELVTTMCRADSDLNGTETALLESDISEMKPPYDEMKLMPEHSVLLPAPITKQHAHGPPRSSSLQTVVTTSFSVDEDREDMGYYYQHAHRKGMYHRRLPSTESRDAFFAPHPCPPLPSPTYYHQPAVRVPPSPSQHIHHSSNISVRRTHSMGGPPQHAMTPLKRSFYHHAQRQEEESDEHDGAVSEFLAPKRMKTTASMDGARHGTYRLPSMPMAETAAAREWFERESWESHQRQQGGYEQKGFARSMSYPWSSMSADVSPPPTSYKGSKVSPSKESPSHYQQHRRSQMWEPPHPHDLYHQQQRSRTHWGPPPMSQQLSSPTRQSGRFWMESVASGEQREEYESARTMSSLRDDEYQYEPSRYRSEKELRDIKEAFEPPRSPADSSRQYKTQSGLIADKIQMVAHAAAQAERREERILYANPQYLSYSEKTEIDGDVTLLALPEDRVSLSETLCVVRENIEVFTATQTDVDAPAPGRKHQVTLHQVGLRCIHCRNTARCSDRVKRAVCYPSSIKRVYRTVIDMKLDHFSQCKYVPADLKEKLNELKSITSRSTGTTMQYFIKAAQSLGMEDTATGVRIGQSPAKAMPPPQSVRSGALEVAIDLTVPPPSQHASLSPKKAFLQRCDSNSMSSKESVQLGRSFSSGSDSCDHSPGAEAMTTSGVDETLVMPKICYQGLIPLSLPEDRSSLSPLRCFLREQVVAFSATTEDIACRAPTTVSLTLHQVGVGCKFCVSQPSKTRSNRAVCFPFSIGRIYQSVADIQRFHLNECKNMPPGIRDKFHDLQTASSKGSKGLATRQYWVSSAKKLGMVDTPMGIRFGRDPAKPETAQAFSLDILAQVAINVTTASKQLVVPEDKESIAEFLYVVMEQLQPCRFTEADRNKRRLKDVGCIGVECKHCAGQVDSRKFFWSSVNAVESNFVSVHTHMLECRMIPSNLKERLTELKALRKEQTAMLRTGSQKAFFAKVWQRLHTDDDGNYDPRDYMDVDYAADSLWGRPSAPYSEDHGEEVAGSPGAGHGNDERKEQKAETKLSEGKEIEQPSAMVQV